MSYDCYPEWCAYGPALCRIEGHEYRNGGICEQCGDRLRCGECGCFIRVDNCEHHYMKAHA